MTYARVDINLFDAEDMDNDEFLWTPVMDVGRIETLVLVAKITHASGTPDFAAHWAPAVRGQPDVVILDNDAATKALAYTDPNGYLGEFVNEITASSATDFASTEEEWHRYIIDMAAVKFLALRFQDISGANLDNNAFSARLHGTER